MRCSRQRGQIGDVIIQRVPINVMQDGAFGKWSEVLLPRYKSPGFPIIGCAVLGNLDPGSLSFVPFANSNPDRSQRQEIDGDLSGLEFSIWTWTKAFETFVPRNKT